MSDKPSDPIDTPSRTPTPHPHGRADSEAPALIVGMGASAGGLEAFQTFFSSMPPDSGLAFVLVQHFDPSRETLLPELLGRITSMPVTLARHNLRVRPNRVYVAPAGAMLAMKSGRLQVRKNASEQERRAAIDVFLQSLAADQEERAASIIFSGLGVDGTVGLEAIKLHGGLALAQQASTAEYESMPASAAHTGLLDDALLVHEMPGRLMEHVQHWEELRAARDGRPLDSELRQHLLAIWRVLRTQTGHDFSRYKPTTMVRRIERRMHVLRIAEVADYVEYLHNEPREARCLFEDLLIGVTHFFRDADAFRALQEQVIPALFEGRAHADQLRIWVPGCATGEEAYSLAILLREHLDRLEDRPRLQVFATDIDERSLDVARQGRYPRSLVSHLSPERVERFFREDSDAYQVCAELREMCLFTHHNLIADPPFSRQDLISCRNLLIYFDQEAQRRLVPLFHYALRPGGFLFLGPSEALAAHPELFSVIDKKYRIFRRQEGVQRPALELLPRAPVQPHTARSDDVQSDSSEALMSKHIERAVLEEYSFPTVTVNQRFDIVYATGPTSEYLSLPSGQPQLNLLQMAKRDLRLELYTVLHKAFAIEDTVTRDARVAMDGEDRRVRLLVRPLSRLSGQSGLYLVVFQDLGPALDVANEIPRGDESEVVRQLEADLQDTRQHLSSTVEKLEASNEELKSSNEELLSINEELQSANEELQTSKEELQSTNEELETVNSEMSRKVEELNRANSDLLNLFQSTHVPTLFLDRDLRIVRFTAAAQDLFSLIDSDTGRPISDITRRFTDVDLEQECRQVLSTLERQVMEVKRPGDDATYIMRIAPYRTVQDVIEGVVVTFADITGLKQAQEALARSETRYRSLLETLTSVVWTASPQGRFTEPQPAFAAYTGQPFDAGGQPLPEGWGGEVYTGHGRDGWLQAIHPEDRALVQQRWREAVATGAEFRAMGRIYHAASRSYRHFEARAVPIGHDDNIDEWVGTLTDVHDRRTTELALLESQSRLDLAVRATELGIFEFEPEGRTTRSNVNNRRILGLPLDREPSYAEFLGCVHPDDRDRVDQAVTRAFAPDGSGTYDLEYRVVWPDGSLHWVQGKARAQFEERDGELRPLRLVGTVQDITEKMRVQQELEQRAAQQAAVSELGLRAMQHSELQAVLELAAEIVTKTLQVSFCKVLERVPDSEDLQLRAGVGWKPGLVGTARIPAGAESLARYTLERQHPVLVRNLGEDTRFEGPPLLLEHGVVSGMSVLIEGPDGAPWGVIGAHSDREQAFTRDDVNFLQAVANILAGTIVRLRSEEALLEAKRSAEEANAAKDRFLAVLSHELRTPLTPVLAAASALESNPDLPAEVSDVLRMIRRNVDLEARLLDDLLDLTRISQGKLKLEPQPVSAEELLERTIGICVQDAKLKGVSLDLDMGERDWTLCVDPSRAMQIFWNLLNNAIKYTAPGGHVEVRCTGVPGHQLRIEIADTGVGMDPELIARVFEPFEQGPPADMMSERFSSQRRGLGLGLAIVRALVQGHGGHVSAQSAGPNRGTTFSIDLPLAPEGMEGGYDMDTTGPVDLPHGPIRLLLVEDHEDSAEILAAVLEAKGMAVTVAESGEQAMAAAHKQHFDVVVSDIGLPDMPGYELFAKLREQQPHLQGVAYSGYGMESDVERCLAAGFREHLTKPVDVGKLERTVYRLMMK